MMKRSHVTDDFKLEAVAQITVQDYPVAEDSKRLGVSQHSLIHPGRMRGARLVVDCGRGAIVTGGCAAWNIRSRLTQSHGNQVVANPCHFSACLLGGNDQHGGSRRSDLQAEALSSNRDIRGRGKQHETVFGFRATPARRDRIDSDGCNLVPADDPDQHPIRGHRPVPHAEPASPDTDVRQAVIGQVIEDLTSLKSLEGKLLTAHGRDS